MLDNVNEKTLAASETSKIQVVILEKKSMPSLRGGGRVTKFIWNLLFFISTFVIEMM